MVSRCNVSSCTFELRQKIYLYKYRPTVHFSNQELLIKLAYLCEIFEKLNALNLSLEESNKNLLNSTEKTSAFIKKELKPWIRKMKQGIFPLVAIIFDLKWS